MTTQNAANIAAEVGTQIVSQATGGLTLGNAVYLNGATYAPAIANTAASARFVGFVIKIIDANTFILQTNGVVSNGLAGLTPGNVYYVSQTMAGQITDAPNFIGGQFLTIALIAQTATSGIILNQQTVGDASNAITSESILDNGQFTVRSKGSGPFTAASTFTNADGAYVIDRFVTLSSAADTIDISIAAGASNAFAQGNTVVFDWQTANEQAGLCQVVYSPSPTTYRNTPLTLTIAANVDAGNTTVSDVRFAIIEWAGAVNNVGASRDPVNVWNGGGIDPTLKANWSYVATSNAITLDTTTRYYSISGTSGAAMNNIAMLFWSDDLNATIGDLLNIQGFWLIPGDNLAVPADATAVATAGAVMPLKSYNTERDNCEKFYFTTYNDNVVPGTVTSAGSFQGYNPVTGTTPYALRRPLPGMIATPTITWYSIVSGAAGNLRFIGGVADFAINATTDNGQYSTGWPTTVVDPGVAVQWIAQITADANL